MSFSILSTYLSFRLWKLKFIENFYLTVFDYLPDLLLGILGLLKYDLWGEDLGEIEDLKISKILIGGEDYTWRVLWRWKFHNFSIADLHHVHGGECRIHFCVDGEKFILKINQKRELFSFIDENGRECPEKEIVFGMIDLQSELATFRFFKTENEKNFENNLISI